MEPKKKGFVFIVPRENSIAQYITLNQLSQLGKREKNKLFPWKREGLDWNSFSYNPFLNIFIYINQKKEILLSDTLSSTRTE